MNYDRQRKRAKAMIEKFGQVVVWRKNKSITPNAAKPWIQSAASPEDHSVSIVFLKPSGGLAAALFHLIKGTDVSTGAPRGLLAAEGLTFTPDLTDSLVVDGEILQLKTIQAVAPSGDAIVYELEFA